MDTDNVQSRELSNIKVLMVEDFGVNQEVFKAMLENTGIKLQIVYNGSEAIKKFKNTFGNFDIIFMDVQMAEMDGYETTRGIRALPEIANARTIPIIAMTAKNSPEDIEKCLRAGMNDYIGKPISRENVIEKIAKHTGAGKESEIAPVVADDTSLYAKYLPYLDIDDMEKRLGCGIDVCKMLLKDFSSQGYTEEFSRTLQNKDRFRAKEIIHNIKGIASNLSLKKLHEKSVEYEQKIKNNTDNLTDIEVLKEIIRRTQEQISDFVKE